MTAIIMNDFITAEQNNALMALGYAWKVKGDWKTTDRVDAWSGMPEVTGSTHYFTDRTEAEAYAVTQTWVFNSNIHGTVEAVEHMETRKEWEERMAREEAEKEAKRAQRKAEKEARDLAKGITPEMRKAMTAKKRHETEIRKLTEEIERLTARIAEERENIAWWDAKIAEMKK